MGISLMAANLLINGFKNHDFTGWEQFTPYDDGSLCTMMTLSTDVNEDNIYSVIVNKREDDEYVFILNIDYADSRSGQGHSCLIRDVMIYDAKGIQRLGVSIGRGQSIIADIVNRPALQNQQRSVSEISEEEEPDEEYDMESEDCEEEPQEDDMEGTSDEEDFEEDECPPEPVPMTRKEKRAEKKRLKKERKELMKKAKMQRPPRGRMKVSNHGRQ